MKETAFIAAFVALFTTSAQADFTLSPQGNNKIGLYLGGQFWQSKASGTLGEQESLLDFDLKNEQQINYMVAIEHPYPLLPNVRIASTALDTSGKTALTQAFTFGDETFSIGDDINAHFNVSYLDYTLYYELFNNGSFSVDLGFTARDFHGDVTVTGPAIIVDECIPTAIPNHCINYDGTNAITPTGKIKTDHIEPMLYAATNINLPLTGLSVFAQGDLSLTNDHSLYDYQVGLSYNLAYISKMNFALTLGYRAVNMTLNDLDNLYTDLAFKGVFVGVIAHF